MSFLYPYVLIALVLPLLLGVGTYLLHIYRRGNWEKLISPEHRRELVRTTSPLHSVVPVVAALLALVCCILAAARPYNGYKNAEGALAGRNILLAIDISRSMETQDVTPSRLEAALHAARVLIDALPTDKIGLIVFSGDTELAIPLTYDHTTLQEFVKQINRNWETYGGSDLEKVLNMALQTFAKTGTNGANALVLLSDGEDTMNFNPSLLEEARKHNLLIMSVGIGTTEGAAIPDPRQEGGLWRDQEGNHVISKLQPNTLNMLARETGGDFFILDGHTDLRAFAQTSAEKLDRHEEKCAINKVPNDVFEYFAIAALVFAFTAILTATRWRRMPSPAGKHVLIIGGALLFATQTLYAAPSAEALHAYKQALAYKAEGKTEECAQALSRALLDEDSTMQATALHALGNLCAEQTFEKIRDLYLPAEGIEATSPTAEQLQEIVYQLEKDCEYYKQALIIRPDYAPAATNLDHISQLIEKLKKEIERLKSTPPEDRQNDNREERQEDKQDTPQDDKQDAPQDNNQQEDKQDSPQNEQEQNTPQQGEEPQQQEKAPENQQKNNSEQEQDNQEDQQQQSDKQQPSSDEKKAQQKKRQAKDFLNMKRDEEAEEEARYSRREFDLKNSRITPNKDY